MMIIVIATHIQATTIMLETTLLAILQGIAEFLPISSSGHLVLGKSLLGLSEVGIRLDIMLHVGTLLSIAVFYFAVIKRILVERDWRYILKVALSAIPAGFVGLLLKDQLETLFASPRAVGVALIFTGLILIATRFMPKGEKDVSFGRALIMGLAQAIAILPGVSRSGMTIAAARSSGVETTKCAEFSFLMSIPPIVGAALLEIVKSLGAPVAQAEAVASAGAEVVAQVSAGVGAVAQAEVSWGLAIYGAIVAAVVGYFALRFLLSSLKSSWFWLFGPYCLVAGLIAAL